MYTYACRKSASRRHHRSVWIVTPHTRTHGTNSSREREKFYVARALYSSRDSRLYAGKSVGLYEISSSRGLFLCVRDICGVYKEKLRINFLKGGQGGFWKILKIYDCARVYWIFANGWSRFIFGLVEMYGGFRREPFDFYSVLFFLKGTLNLNATLFAQSLQFLKWERFLKIIVSQILIWYSMPIIVKLVSLFLLLFYT